MNAKRKKTLRNAVGRAGRWLLAVLTAFYAVAPISGACRCGEDCRCDAARAFAVESDVSDASDVRNRRGCGGCGGCGESETRGCGCGCGRESSVPTETRGPSDCSCSTGAARCKATLRRVEVKRENETKRSTREWGTVWASSAADWRRENERRFAARANVAVPRARERLYLLLSTLLN
ncbi:MAG: hypothetical protein IJE97_13260 [Thermoguttaceae bacterium]|nr:hypothetical protein [Thermoguttaceae bacterium]